MEIFRLLGALIEPPAPELRPLADTLDLGPLPPEADHTELFTFQLYPYASVYLGAEGMLGGEARDRIAGFWRALGLNPPDEPDHLTVMLATYAELCERQEGSSGEDRPRWRQARKAFLWEHLLSWLQVYLGKLRELAPPFYRKWGKVLVKALESEAGRLGAQERLPLHLRAAPELEGPEEGTSEAFLGALLSPVQSGWILTRSDLGRASRDLQLGLRMGERKYALKALLTQDAVGTLSWLTTEAGAWAERHRQTEPLVGAISGFWAGRAAATAALLAELRADY